VALDLAYNKAGRKEVTMTVEVKESQRTAGSVKPRYEAPVLLPLGEIARSVGGACHSGATNTGGNCSAGGHANSGTCANGSTL
jgi:hypothetical protein